MVSLPTLKQALLLRLARSHAAPPPVGLLADRLREHYQARKVRDRDIAVVSTGAQQQLDDLKALQELQDVRLFVLCHVGGTDVEIQFNATVDDHFAEYLLGIATHLHDHFPGCAEQGIAGSVNLKFRVESHADVKLIELLN
jgi:hypothetical protein